MPHLANQILWDNRRRKPPWAGVSVSKVNSGTIMKQSMSNRSRRHILIGACLITALCAGQMTLAKHVDGQSDNSGRQIAAVIPGMPHPITITVPNLAPSQHHKSSTPIIQTRGRTTTITVPKSVEEAVDIAWVSSNKFAKASYQKAIEIWKWLAAWYKQHHSMPMATPIGSPYVQGPVNPVHQLYYTHEGRLKTVVKQ